MIVRVPDYYNDFHCIAEKCRHSCCIGWEIDIDEDTYEYFSSIPGKFGRRLKENMVRTDEGDCCFKLSQDGRCPFLNKENLCDICTELGEEALSEVCTEYPRFPVYYGDVLQKSLTLSCEEVGRLVFTNPDIIKILDFEVPSEEDFFEEEQPADEDSGADQYEDPETISVLEEAQDKLIGLLQNREKSLGDRITDAFSFCSEVQKKLDAKNTGAGKQTDYHGISLQKAAERLDVFEQLETDDDEWEEVKAGLHAFYSGDAEHALTETKSFYEKKMADYINSNDHREADYEHLLVYFVFRYVMTAAMDGNLISKLNLAVEFTLFIRDMAAERFSRNGGRFSTEDMIDTARIFSKAVEHAEENVAFAEEQFFFC